MRRYEASDQHEDGAAECLDGCEQNDALPKKCRYQIVFGKASRAFVVLYNPKQSG
jgi:hypothetical protein